MEAAKLAQAGATGNASVFEGAFGFARLHHGASFDNLPEWNGVKPGIERHRMLRKPWPSCAYTHRVIDAALKLHPHFKAAADVTQIAIHMPEPFFRVSGFVSPTTANEARFSATYCTLAALLDGAVGPASFSPEAFLRPEIANLLTRVAINAYDPGPDLSDMSPDHPDTVSLHLSDGAIHSESVDHVAGGPNRPMTQPELHEKFIACGGSKAMADDVLRTDIAAEICLIVNAVGPALTPTITRTHA